jgi:hypothetical protein
MFNPKVKRVERKNKGRFSRQISLMLALVLILSLFPLINPVAAGAAEGSGSIGHVDDETFRRLGFDVESTNIKTVMEDTSPDAQPMGYGSNSFCLLPMDDLFLFKSNYSYLSYSGWETSVYGKMNLSAAPSNGAFRRSQDKAATRLASASIPDNDMSRSVAFDPTNSGFPDHVAIVYGRVTGGSTYLSLAVLTPEGERYTQTLYKLPFDVKPIEAGAFLSVTAGDYDNDGKQELAAYYPHNIVYGPCIVIFEFTGAGFSERKVIELTNYNFKNFPEKNDWRYKYAYPAVDLCTVSQPIRSRADDLVIAYSPPRHGNDLAAKLTGGGYDATDSFTHVLCCHEPLISEKRELIGAWFNWRDDYGFISANSRDREELMMFGGVSAGDIDGDGLQEVVVAGYRLKEANTSKNNWDLSEEDYLVTYIQFDYDADTDTGVYEEAQPGQRIPYNGSSKGLNYQRFLDPKIYNNKNEWDIVHEPLAVQCFAERGAQFADSVFVEGLVLALQSQTQSGDLPMMTLQENKNNTTTIGIDIIPSPFLVRWTAPLVQLTRYPNNILGNNKNRLVMEAVAGNFDENPFGKQQIIFTYIQKNSDVSYSTALCMIANTASGDLEVVNNVTIDGLNAYSTIENGKFCCELVSYKVSYPSLTIAATDQTKRSMVARYTDKPPEFYFSDPQIIAVLQAPPYFEELDYYPGYTSITKSQGSSTGHDHSLTYSASASIGVYAKATFIIEWAEVSWNNTFSLSVGYSRSETETTTYSTSFSTVGTSTVALGMVPMIRYYYEVWRPELSSVPETGSAGAWEPMV